MNIGRTKTIEWNCSICKEHAIYHETKIVGKKVYHYYYCELHWRLKMGIKNGNRNNSKSLKSNKQ